MLKKVAKGVLVHQSAFCQSNSIGIQGRAGVLLIDPGILDSEMICLADDLLNAGQSAIAAFSTHPHWDHLLWHPRLGSVPRYCTDRCAAIVRDRLSGADALVRVTAMIPPDIADHVPLDLLGRVTALPAEAAQIPWDGPKVNIIEHDAHASGHAALFLKESGVLVAGDMLSDVLVPLLDLSANDPIEDYLTGLQRLESILDDVEVLIPGHESDCGITEARLRIERDRAYIDALRDNAIPDDQRIGPSATYGWVANVHARQLQHLTRKRENDGMADSR